jgi:hypothetical protein
LDRELTIRAQLITNGGTVTAPSIIKHYGVMNVAEIMRLWTGLSWHMLGSTAGCCVLGIVSSVTMKTSHLKTRVEPTLET